MAKFLITIFKPILYDPKITLCKKWCKITDFLPIFFGITDPIRIKLFTRDSTPGALSYDTKNVQIGALREKIFVLEDESRTKFSYIYN